jgi:hypothetical protein
VYRPNASGARWCASNHNVKNVHADPHSLPTTSKTVPRQMRRGTERDGDAAAASGGDFMSIGTDPIRAT